ncbi:MAG: pyridoxamine 5'-phosphate oxidase family protein [Bacteroidota bacterium]
MLITKESSLEEVWQVAWDYLRRAAVDKGHPMRYLTLATSGPPDIGLRMVVLREIQQDLSLLMYTDARSAKVRQIRENSLTSILAYHPKHKVQIRLQGESLLHQRDVLAQAAWQRVQGPPQKAYNSLLPPGEEVSTPSEAHRWPEEMDEGHFCLIQFRPLELEVLQLNGLAHIRALFTISANERKGKWIVP